MQTKQRFSQRTSRSKAEPRLELEYPSMDDRDPELREVIRLRNGTQVTLRSIVPEDAPKLRALHGRLSAQSIYQRFFEQLKELPLERAKRLAQVDYRSRMALVATLAVADDEQIIGVARYGVDPSIGPDIAEIGIVVEDRYHGLGLGTALLDRLGRYAVSHGIRTFLAVVRHDNEQVLRILRRSRLPIEKEFQSGVWEIKITLPSESEVWPPDAGEG